MNDSPFGDKFQKKKRKKDKKKEKNNNKSKMIVPIRSVGILLFCYMTALMIMVVNVMPTVDAFLFTTKSRNITPPPPQQQQQHTYRPLQFVIQSRTLLSFWPGSSFQQAVPSSSKSTASSSSSSCRRGVSGFMENNFDMLVTTTPIVFIMTMIMIIPVWGWWEMTKYTIKLQRFGENMFLALLCIALLQGAIATFQYRNNPKGELMIPPGLTIGKELPELPDEPPQQQRRPAPKKKKMEKKQQDQQKQQTSSSSSLLSSTLRVDASTTSYRSGRQSNIMTETTIPFYEDRDKKVLPSKRRNISSASASGENGEEEGEDPPLPGSSSSSSSKQEAILQRASRLMVILLPWLWGRASFIFQRNSHLLHIGSILTLTSVFDIPQTYFQSTSRNRVVGGVGMSNSTTIMTTNTTTTTTHGATSINDLSLSKSDQEHVIVIGDSLAVGLGTVDQYDRNKTNDAPFRRIENTILPSNQQHHHHHHHRDEHHHHQQQGPAFPQAFAKTLAQRLRKPVTWRSAGVDGGDIPKIREYCLSLIEEEIQNGKVPDVVVLLCGANDMKYFLSNPLDRTNWPKAFRQKLTNFLQEIRELAPNTTIVLPAFPTQMFHKNSPLNVFPLGILLDSMAAYFDSQKKFVADCFPSDGVFFVGLSPREVSRWYNDDDDDGGGGNDDDDGTPKNEDPFNVQVTINKLLEEIESFSDGKQSSHGNSTSLIAADGVHPNARCYTKWASAIGKELIAMLPQDETGALK